MKKITIINTYWISFSNGTNLGCCIVEATDVKAAHLKTIELGINPGGELLITPFDDSAEAKAEIEKWGKNKLISKEALIAAQYIPTSEMDQEIQDQIYSDPRVSKICGDCNDEMI